MTGRANFLPYQIGADGKASWALPGILAGAANAVTAPYRAMNPQDYPDFNAEQEAADFALNMMGGGTVFGSAPKNALGMNVWHGSPHKFEPTELNDLGEFNAAKIGTGEGAQAYSHGHYTGEAQATGEGYRNRLAQSQVEPSDYSEYFAPGSVRPTYGGHDKILNFDPESGIVTAQSVVKNKNNEWVPEPNSQVRKHSTMPNVAELEKTLGRKPGYLYKVDIPDEHIAKMLDWDKPLSEQSESVQAILASTKNKQLRAIVDYASSPYSTKGLEGEVKTMGEAIKLLGMNTSPAKGSALLAKQGIPGVRYLDAGSRRAEGGTSNFVVFPGNEHMMTILERNGQAMSPESQAIARYREIKGAKSVVRMEAALRTAGVPLPKNEPVAYIQSLVDRAHRRN
jgi:hypothetical protein